MTLRELAEWADAQYVFSSSPEERQRTDRRVAKEAKSLGYTLEQVWEEVCYLLVDQIIQCPSCAGLGYHDEMLDGEMVRHECGMCYGNGEYSATEL